MWELQKEPEKKRRNTNTLKIDVRHRYDANFVKWEVINTKSTEGNRFQVCNIARDPITLC